LIPTLAIAFVALGSHLKGARAGVFVPGGGPQLVH
jgi:hypothetical protein